ncbi:type IV pilus biogenesis protein PilP [Burkholderia ambifaria]|uniref:type IV pilus biogenesis protein PilP n=1 Tax=Burkholderia ambifaria TaxID=152480 RepID=UPI001FC80768|nr:type IV pilus biogenesis protein PilP [Burkholderia ambifaria]
MLVLACCCAWPLAASGAASAAAATAAAPAEAAPRLNVVPTPAAMQAANELMRLQEETMILKAQLKKLDAQAQVAERQEALHRMGSTVSSYSDVSLVATQGLGKKLSATVATSDGAEFDVGPGDTLPNGLRVAAIRPGAIVLASQDGRRTTLTVSASARQQPARNVASTGSPGVPPVPTLPALPMPAR